MQLRTNLALLLSLLIASPALAEAWGVGVYAGTDPGLSVQLAPSKDFAYHAAGTYLPGLARASLDLQRHFTPRFGYGNGWRLSLYGGAGVQGTARRDDESPETYHARLPLGVQCDVRTLHTAVFAELTPLLGALPTTKLSHAAAIGVRAVL